MALPAVSHRTRPLRIALVSGPCGGKSASLLALKAHFEAKGFAVYTVPEVATLFRGNGAVGGFVQMCQSSPSTRVELQSMLLGNQLQLEETFLRLAEYEPTAKSVIVFCDRGALDGSAYCSTSEWEQVMQRVGSRSDSLRDRYDAILHLVSAAIGAEHIFRSERLPDTPRSVDGAAAVQAAAALDRRTIKAYSGHRRIVTVDNQPNRGWGEKLAQAIAVVEELAHEHFKL